MMCCAAEDAEKGRKMNDVKDYDWDEIRDALGIYVEWLKKNEPFAFSSIATFEKASDECPASDDFD